MGLISSLLDVASSWDALFTNRSSSILSFFVFQFYWFAIAQCGFPLALSCFFFCSDLDSLQRSNFLILGLAIQGCHLQLNGCGVPTALKGREGNKYLIEYSTCILLACYCAKLPEKSPSCSVTVSVMWIRLNENVLIPTTCRPILLSSYFIVSRAKISGYLHCCNIIYKCY